MCNSQSVHLVDIQFCTEKPDGLLFFYFLGWGWAWPGQSILSVIVADDGPKWNWVVTQNGRRRLCVYVRALLFLVGKIVSFWSPPPCATVSKCVRVWWSKAGTRHTCHLIPLLIQSTCVISPAAAEGGRNIYRYTIRLFGPTVFGSSRLCYIQLSKMGTRRPQKYCPNVNIFVFPF